MKFIRANFHNTGRKTGKFISALLLSLFVVLNCTAAESDIDEDKAPLKEDTTLVDWHIKAGRNKGIPADSALQHLNIAMALAKKLGYQKRMGIIWGLIAGTHLRVGDFDECKLYLDSAFRLNEQLKDGELTCILNSGIAGWYQYTSNYAKAASHYFRALAAVQEYKLGSTRPGVLAYINIAGFMSLLGEDSLSHTYLLLAKSHALNMKPIDSPLLTRILLSIGEADLELNSSSTVGYYKDALRLAQKVNDRTYSYGILINLSISYIKQKKFDSAEHYLRLSKEFAEPGVPTITTMVIAGQIAYYKKNYSLAIKELQTALDLSEGEDYEYLEQAYEALSEIYKDQGLYQKAYEYHVKYVELHEKKAEDQKKIVGDFMISVQSLEHEKRIMQKQAEILAKEAAIRKRNFWITAMCVLSGLLGLILFMAFRNYQHRKTLLNEQMRTLQQDQEIERLKAEAEGADKERSRIAYDLHDGVLVRLASVKMNLAGLPSFSENSRYKDMIFQLDTATKELRNTAHNLMPEVLLEDGLAQAIFYFCKTTEQSSGIAIKFQQVGTPFPRLQPQVETAIYRIVQGLVQNIIQHAGATTALVQLQYAGDLCSITVEDNGMGMEAHEKEEGYGLKSIRNRVKVLKGTFDIESEKEQGTAVYIEFDVTPFLYKPATGR